MPVSGSYSPRTSAKSACHGISGVPSILAAAAICGPNVGRSGRRGVEYLASASVVESLPDLGVIVAAVISGQPLDDLPVLLHEPRVTANRDAGATVGTLRPVATIHVAGYGPAELHQRAGSHQSVTLGQCVDERVERFTVGSHRHHSRLGPPDRCHCPASSTADAGRCTST